MTTSKCSLNDQIKLQDFYTKTDGAIIFNAKYNVERLDIQLIPKIREIFQSIEKLNEASKDQAEILEHCIKPKLSELLELLSPKIDNFYHQTVQSSINKPNPDAHDMLQDLQKRLGNIQFEKIAISTFSDEIKIPKEERTAFENFLCKILRNVLNKLETKIFGGYQANLKNESHTQKMKNLITQLEKTGLKLSELDQKKLMNWIQEKKKTEKELKKNEEELKKLGGLTGCKIDFMAAEGPGMSKQEQLRKKISELEETQKILNNSPQAETYNQLAKNQRNILDEMSKLSPKLDKMTQNKKKGKETRQNMLLIGGEQILIHDKTSKSDLDGMYLSADKFRQSLKESGAQIGTYKHKEKSMTGFLLPKNENSLPLLQALKTLGIDGANWKLIETEGNSFLIQGEDYAILSKDQVDFTSLSLTSAEINLDQKSEGGTIILTSGNTGVYEMHKKEMLAYLLKGMNVMAFNFSGYGESTGVPGDKALKSNMKAAYQHLIKYHRHLTSDEKIDNSKIMLKAMCMSGGPATYLASQKECEGMHLFLDQSYADFRDLIKEQIKDGIGKRYPRFAKLLGSRHINSLSNLIAKFIAPNWKIKEDIKSVKGTITFLSIKNDTLIPAKQGVNQNIASLNSIQTSNDKIKIYEMEGTHGISLANVKERHVVLKENINVTNPKLKNIIDQFKEKSTQGVVTEKELKSIIYKELSQIAYMENWKVFWEQAEALFDFSSPEYLPGMEAINGATQNAKITGSIFPEISK